MIEKIEQILKSTSNIEAFLLVALGVVLVLLHQSTAGNALVAGGLTHLKS